MELLYPLAVDSQPSVSGAKTKECSCPQGDNASL
jgi:hypothetical protein